MESVPTKTNEYQETRDALAEKLKGEPDYYQRREVLRQAQLEQRYQEAKNWKKRWREEFIENKEFTALRLEFGLISETEKQQTQYEVTERFLRQLGNKDDAELRKKLLNDPSPFVRLEVASTARIAGDEEVLARLSRDPNSEIRSFARRAYAEIEVRRLLSCVESMPLSFRFSDLFRDTPMGSGERLIIIRHADRRVLQDEYDIGEEEFVNLKDPHHVRAEEAPDMLWWGLIDIHHFPDGRKAWLLEEVQSDFLQKTRNLKLRGKFFEKCGACEGRGQIKKSKREYIKCDQCQGAGVFPEYIRQLFDDVIRLAEKSGVDLILMPKSKTMVEKYLGLLRPAKAQLLYDVMPRRIGLGEIRLDSDIEFGNEDGNTVRSSEFWFKEL